MTRITVSRDIGADPAVVFAAVADIASLTEVSPDVLHIEFLTEQHSGVGTRFRETRRMGTKEMVTELEVTEYELNRRARLVTDMNGTVWDTTFTVDPLPQGARLTIAMDARAYKLLPRLLNPILKGMFRRGMNKHVQFLADYCERKAGNTAGVNEAS